LRFSIFTVYLAALGGLSSIAFGFFEFKYGNPEYIKLWGRTLTQRMATGGLSEITMPLTGLYPIPHVPI
jgi:hypothetical protein